MAKSRNSRTTYLIFEASLLVLIAKLLFFLTSPWFSLHDSGGNSWRLHIKGVGLSVWTVLALIDLEHGAGDIGSLSFLGRGV